MSKIPHPVKYIWVVHATNFKIPSLVVMLARHKEIKKE